MYFSTLTVWTLAVSSLYSYGVGTFGVFFAGSSANCMMLSSYFFRDCSGVIGLNYEHFGSSGFYYIFLRGSSEKRSD